MFRRIDDFLATLAAETEHTLTLFRAIPESAAGQAVTQDGRTLGRLAWHITCAFGEIAKSGKIGAIEPHDDQTGDVPPIAEIIATYEKNAAAFAQLLPAVWQDDMLDQKIPMYGMEWRRGDALMMIVTHQCHHRGQMTVLMRQAGLKVPGILGPAREEWAQWGMQAQR